MEQPPAAAVKRGLRFRILARDDFTCQYCGRAAPQVKLEVDHIIPRSRGGANTADNLITACFDCNQGKKAMELSAEQVARLSKPAAAAVSRAVRVHRARRATGIGYRKAPGVTVHLYHGGQFVKTQTRPRLPVSGHFEYVAPDTFIGEFICDECGMVNTYEGDQCSCRKRRREREQQVRDDMDRWFRNWSGISEANRFAYGEAGCQCIDPGTPDGTMCDRCLLSMERNLEFQRRVREAEYKDDYGCDCWDCEWCEEHHLCLNCDERTRERGSDYCTECNPDEDEA